MPRIYIPNLNLKSSHFINAKNSHTITEKYSSETFVNLPHQAYTKHWPGSPSALHCTWETVSFCTCNLNPLRNALVKRVGILQNSVFSWLSKPQVRIPFNRHMSIYLYIPTLNFLFWGWCHNFLPERAINLPFGTWVVVHMNLLIAKFQLHSS